MCRALQRCLISIALSLFATIAAADAITITFEQTLDLDTGTIGDLDILPDESTGADVRISYHAERAEHAVVPLVTFSATLPVGLRSTRTPL